MTIRTKLASAGAAALLFVGLLSQVTGATAAVGVSVPAPAIDAPAKGLQTAVLAGGCFWGVQGVYAHVNGVTRVVSGYIGGTAANARYDAVGGGDTGHAEAVHITYDPAKVSYGQLLRIYFSVVADPTTLNYQGPDHGTQYRSAIFPLTADQNRVARAYIAQLGQAGTFKRPIVTKIERAQGFFPAEAYHQDYYFRNPDAGYIRVHDKPKVAALKAMFPQNWRAKPVLVRG